MIRLACLQFRAQAATALAALAALAVVLAVTGPRLTHLYGGVAACTTPSECTAAATALTTKLPFVRVLSALAVLCAPGLIGVFWGAPLITRELETGTLRLAWTQSITRTRWLAVKLALAGLASIATAGLFSVTAGAFIRRTLPAMVVTLAIFAAVQGYVMPQLIRPHLIRRPTPAWPSTWPT